jgi:hypothetical protein
MPESAERYRARTGYTGIIERCVVCWEIRPRHWTSPHLFKGGHLVFIEDEPDETKGENS